VGLLYLGLGRCFDAGEKRQAGVLDLQIKSWGTLALFDVPGEVARVFRQH
jgi:hypothetical protein